MAHAFSTAVGVAFDLLLAPFGDRSGLALAVVSLLCGVVMMLLFKATSRQERIRAERQVFQARVLEMRIYQDDLVLILKALGAALWTNVRYLRLVLVPILVIGVFAAIVFVQLEARFGRAKLGTHATTLVTVTYQPGTDVMTAPLTIAAGDGAAIDSPPVRVPARNEVSWRVRVEGRGAPTVTLGAGEATYRFALAAAPGTAPVGDLRSRSAWDALLHPGLPPLPAQTPIERVAVAYPQALHALLGWQLPWLAVFIIWSMVGALVPKVLFRIEV